MPPGKSSGRKAQNAGFLGFVKKFTQILAKKEKTDRHRAVGRI